MWSMPILVRTQRSFFRALLVASSRPPRPVSRIRKSGCFSAAQTSIMRNRCSKKVGEGKPPSFESARTLSWIRTKSSFGIISPLYRIRSRIVTRWGERNTAVEKPASRKQWER